MDAILHKVSIFIDRDKRSLTKELLKQAIEQLDLQLTGEQVEKHTELLQKLLSSISIALISTRQVTKEMKLEYDLDNYFYYNGTSLKETIEILSTFRLALLSELQRRGLLERLDSIEMANFYNHVIFIFDDAIRNTTINFNLENQKVMNTIEEEMLELAAPIVPIKNGVAVLPLIGNLSETRASYITNNVIPKVSHLNLEILVIDFSGIQNFDAHVAQQVFQIRDVLNLLGIQPIVTGIRPFIAQTAVNLGINIKDLQTYSTVKQFLEILDNNNILYNHNYEEATN
jgi:rsbT co-antagonist protein RsbR